MANVFVEGYSNKYRYEKISFNSLTAKRTLPTSLLQQTPVIQPRLS